jgi:hypothetical protein
MKFASFRNQVEDLLEALDTKPVRIRVTNPLEVDPAAPKRDLKWEGLPEREAAEAAEQAAELAAKERAIREERFKGKSAREIAEMMREDIWLGVKAKDDAAREDDRQRRGKTGIMGR